MLNYIISINFMKCYTQLTGIKVFPVNYYAQMTYSLLVWLIIRQEMRLQSSHYLASQTLSQDKLGSMDTFKCRDFILWYLIETAFRRVCKIQILAIFANERWGSKFWLKCPFISYSVLQVNLHNFLKAILSLKCSGGDNMPSILQLIQIKLAVNLYYNLTLTWALHKII